MTLTTTYDSTLSRVVVAASGLGNVGTVLFERSLDQITWTSVRCGVDSPVVSGAATIYDYEFTSGVVNYYRTTSYQEVTFVATGTAAHASNANVSPGLPAGLLTGDFMFLLAAIRNVGAGTVNTPAGWTLFGDVGGNLRLFAKIAGPGEVAPTVSFSGGVANATTSAQICAFRNLSAPSANVIAQSNTSQANIPYPALDVTINHALILIAGWRQQTWTSIATLSGYTEIGDAPSGAVGSTQGIVWDFQLQVATTPADVTAGQFTVTGGSNGVSSSMVLGIGPPAQVTQTSSITPTIDQPWLKSIGRPFLNRTFFCVTNDGPIERGPRNQLFEVVGRSFPVAVTDVRQSREVSIDVITQTSTQWQELDTILAAGEPMFFHTPKNYPIPSMYVVIDRTSMARPRIRRDCGVDYRITTLPLREVATPGLDICGSTVTWQGVVNFYASWNTVIAGESSWLDLMANIGSPADVIVP